MHHAGESDYNVLVSVLFFFRFAIYWAKELVAAQSFWNEATDLTASANLVERDGK